MPPATSPSPVTPGAAPAKPTSDAPSAPNAPNEPNATHASNPDASRPQASSESRASPTAPSDAGPRGTTAHALYSPLPDVPDDAREDAFSAVAVARFTVHPDGRCDVTLVEPTPNPTLNRLLLASLRQWRFAAATEDGHAVETTLDLRVHFNVR
ncbi:TonB family protein [Pararobbsia silviterrae]|nr:TonB family protein [Pararobbsia silviterrae]